MEEKNNNNLLNNENVDANETIDHKKTCQTSQNDKVESNNTISNTEKTKDENSKNTNETISGEKVDESQLKDTKEVEKDSSKKKKRTPYQIFKLVMEWVVGVFIGIVFVFEIVALSTSGSNNGVPNLAGFSFMNVLTDSMVPTLPVNTGIVTKKVPLTELKGSSGKDNEGNWIIDGDIISFKGVITLSGKSYNAVITHRIMEIDKDTSGNVTLIHCMGDNVHAQTCPSGGCTYETYQNKVKPEEYIGKVIYNSDTLGGFIRATQSAWFFWVVVGCPLAVLFILSIFDVIKAAKMKEIPDYLKDKPSENVIDAETVNNDGKITKTKSLYQSKMEEEAYKEASMKLKEQLKNEMRAMLEEAKKAKEAENKDKENNEEKK